MMIRVRSRDGLKRITVPNPNPNTTISDLKLLIETELRVPISQQTLSQNINLLTKTPEDTYQFIDMSNPKTLLSSIGISHGSVIYLYYEGERSVAKMTMDDLIATQIRVSRQETAHCESVSFDRDAANAFQHYVNERFAFRDKRGGFMYGRVSEDGKVKVDFIYEPLQEGTEDNLILHRDWVDDEETCVEAIAMGLGLRKVGFIFTQTVGQNKKDYTLSNKELLQAAELHGESGLKEWVTAVVKLEVNEAGGTDVHFEAFQMSDVCVKLLKDGLFETECGEEFDPKFSRIKKEVVVGANDTKEVDNDFFLVAVKILDHQGPLSSTFPIENRDTLVTTRTLKTHFERTKNLSFVKRISDFHLLLLLVRFFDLKSDVPTILECVKLQTTVPEIYQFIVDSILSVS